MFNTGATMPTSSTHSPRVLSASRSRWLGQVAVGAAVLVLATACGSGSSSDNAGASPSGAGAAPSGGLATTSTSLGTILTDSAGKTIYSFAADTKGVSNCSGSCASYWPPVPVTGSVPKDPQGVTAKLGELTRDDGTKQLTVNGMPMYTYVGDSAKGDTTGQNLNQSGGLWWVIATNGSSIKSGAPGM
jgi:predicted lipoprotein with Yx(FWY)xxD motif